MVSSTATAPSLVAFIDRAVNCTLRHAHRRPDVLGWSAHRAVVVLTAVVPYMVVSMLVFRRARAASYYLVRDPLIWFPCFGSHV